MWELCKGNIVCGSTAGGVTQGPTRRRRQENISQKFRREIGERDKMKPPWCACLSKISDAVLLEEKVRFPL